MYENMVKEAYDQIMGFDKEAGVKDVAGSVWAATKKAGKGYADALKGTDIHNAVSDLKINPRVVSKDFRNKAKGNLALGAAKTVGAYAAPVAAATTAAVALKKRHDRKKEEQAEKAAAYYDEAQLVKEAAERDYQEACAYEEAALEILAELGYLDDFDKEADEYDYEADDNMSAEELDEAAFNYLAERGYFDED